MSYEHRHDLFEEARATRLQGIKRDLIRDDLMPIGGIPNVSYFGSVEEQNRFLESISNTEFGRQLQNWQSRYNAQGISLILPKFSNINNISLNEQLFLAIQSIGLEKYMDGSYRVDGGKKQSILLKQLALTKGKIGGYYQFVEPSEYYISIGAVPEHLLKEIKTHGATSGTGFQRGHGFVGDEPEVTTDHIQPQITPTSTQKKPGSVFQQEPEPEVTTDHIQPQITPTSTQKKPESVFQQEPEPEVTTDHIQPPSEEQDFLPPTSQVDPPVVVEEEVTTSQVDPPVVVEEEVTTSQIDPVGEETTAKISWFGDTWLPYHFNFDRRRR